MKYIGIDLGTSNSVICSYDGKDVQTHSNPDDNSPTTASVIYIDKRGGKFFGTRAYNQAARDPANAAVKFKRLMGTSTPIQIGNQPALTPEECSAAVLAHCFGYLPDDMRKSESLGVVVTVPAAFDQMQKSATLAAAQMAGLGEVALIQEPVAAIMSIMRNNPSDGMFLVFDMGAGTLDVAIAESINGSITLLSHGGVAMCGGVDFDRRLHKEIIEPWLAEKFDFSGTKDDASKQKLERMSIWAAEKAKIQLSSAENCVIQLTEEDLNMRDASGQEIYLDIPLSRSQLNNIISERVSEAIRATKNAMEKAGVLSTDIGRIIFVGGPTKYSPLRDMVCDALGIEGSTEVDPMTAVAIGAAVFAESIDWSSNNRSRKSNKGTIKAVGDIGVSFDFIERTPSKESRLVVRLPKEVEGYEFRIVSIDSGWISDRTALVDGKSITVPLIGMGSNTFRVEVFAPNGIKLVMPLGNIVIVRAAASVDGIPASTSVAIESRERAGGRMGLSFLVKEGDVLPKKGRKVFKAETKIRAGSTDAINFKLWAGEIENPISDNQFIGVFSILGTDFDFGAISPGDELVCDYQMDDAGIIFLEVSVPSIGNSFRSDKNFYSPTAARIDYSQGGAAATQEVRDSLEKVTELSSSISDPRLSLAKGRLEGARQLLLQSDNGAETTKMAADEVQQAKHLIYLTKKDYKKEFQQADLDVVTRNYRDHFRPEASAADRLSCDTLIQSVQRAIDHQLDVDELMKELRSSMFLVLWRSDKLFSAYASSVLSHAVEYPSMADRVQLGTQLLRKGMLDELRDVILEIIQEMPGGDDGAIDMAAANIIQG